jgi:alpha-tubulin suppressor-like RCC1 family protein
MSAIQSNGTLWMWGNNSFGQLGVGSAGTNIISPVQVGSLSSWLQIRCGFSARALQSDGTLWSWGNNSWGQLGQNNISNYNSN